MDDDRLPAEPGPPVPEAPHPDPLTAPPSTSSQARRGHAWTVVALALDGDKARAMHDETLPDVAYKNAEYCSMCGEQFCAMRISKGIERHRYGEKARADRSE